jgi:hypothetical protein
MSGDAPPVDEAYAALEPKSRELFGRVDTPEEFRLLWRRFYRNEIVTPGYCGTFQPAAGGGGNHDNPQATPELAELFYEATTLGLIPIGSQAGDPESGQKSFLQAFSNDFELVQRLCLELNRRNGLVAYALEVDFAAEQDFRRNAPIHLTIDGTAASLAASTAGRLAGDHPYTAHHFDTFRGGANLAETFEWLRDAVEPLFTGGNTWWALMAIDADYRRPNYLLETVVETLRKATARREAS